MHMPQVLPASKFGKTNLDFLKYRLQHKKEITQTVVQTGTADPHSQATSNYANTEIPYQGVSDKARKYDLVSLRNRLEKAKEQRVKTVLVGAGVMPADYCNVGEISTGISENPVTIKNPPDKKPMASPRITPANSASSSKRTYQLWQCAHCQIINEAHHTACECCKLPPERMVKSYFCNFCQMMIFVPIRRVGFKDTYCPRCKQQVYESAL